MLQKSYVIMDKIKSKCRYLIALKITFLRAVDGHVFVTNTLLAIALSPHLLKLEVETK